MYVLTTDQDFTAEGATLLSAILAVITALVLAIIFPHMKLFTILVRQVVAVLSRVMQPVCARVVEARWIHP